MVPALDYNSPCPSPLLMQGSGAMNCNDVKESQAKQICEALYRPTNYLVRLRRRWSNSASRPITHCNRSLPSERCRIEDELVRRSLAGRDARLGPVSFARVYVELRATLLSQEAAIAS